MSRQNRPVYDRLLSNVSQMYAPQNYVANKILPVKSALGKTGQLLKYGTGHLRLEMTLVVGKSGYRYAEPISRTTTQYNISRHGLKGIVTEDDYANQNEYDAEADETMGVSHLLWTSREKSFADKFFSATYMTNGETLSGADQFSEPLTSDPVAYVREWRKSVKDACGFNPNKVLMGDYVAECLRYHPQIIDYLKYTKAPLEGLSDQELARFFKVDQVLIGDAQYESAKEGQSSSMAAIWGNHLLMYYAPAQAMKYQQSLGYYMTLEGENGENRVFKSPNADLPNATNILVDMAFDGFITNVNCAYLAKDVVADPS